MEATYLKYLQIYHQSKDDNGSLFRTLVDNWFGYAKAGPFLSKNDKPRWFNNPDPVKNRDALLAMDFVSCRAFRVIEGLQEDNLVKDHAIPIKVLRSSFKNLQEPSASDIENFLNENYRLGVITKFEDKLLNQKKLRSKMPDSWDNIDWQARYVEAGIERHIR